MVNQILISCHEFYPSQALLLVPKRLGRQFARPWMVWRVLVSEIKGFQCLVSIFAFEFSFVIIIESGHFKYFKIFKSFLEPIGVITRYLIALFELFQVNFEWSHDFWQIFLQFWPKIGQDMDWDWVAEDEIGQFGGQKVATSLLGLYFL